jgi:hypothetical protein
LHKPLLQEDAEMKFVLITAIIAVTALAVPSFAAFDIPEPEPQVIESPVVEMPVPDAAWTADMQDSVSVQPAETPEVIAPAPVQPIDVHIETPSFVAPETSTNLYVKTQEDMHILNTTISSSHPLGSPVPEPGTVAGMSAGLAGIFFGLRRSRKQH